MTQPVVQSLLPAGSPLPGDYYAQTVTNANGIVARTGCRLRRVAAQTLNDASLTDIEWDTEDDDTDNLWSSGSPTVITIPEDGLWLVCATYQSSTAGNVDGRSFINIALTSGVTGNPPQVRGFHGAGESLATVTAAMLLEGGDSFTVEVLTNLSVASTTMVAWLSCYRVTGGAS